LKLELIALDSFAPKLSFSFSEFHTKIMCFLVLRFAVEKETSKIKEHIPAARSVVDLHIEKLMDRHSHLTNAEIIHFQLEAFEKWFELAQLNYLPSMIIIHGIGSGKLKNEVHDLLKVKKGVKSFINQYSDFYGYGATEVFFEY
jgi:dsDNA-specific endonuclease/ATPase MutS2